MRRALFHVTGCKRVWDDYRAYRRLAVRYLAYARAGAHKDPAELRVLAREYAARATRAKRFARRREVEV